MEYNFVKIGERIIEERKKQKISQEKLIEILKDNFNFHITRNRLSSIENGNQDKFSFDFLYYFSKVINCDIGYLLGEYNEKTHEKHQLSSITGLNEFSIDFLLKLKTYKVGAPITIPVETNKEIIGLIDSERAHPTYIVNLLLNNPHIIGLIYSYMTIINENNSTVYQGDRGNSILFELMLKLREIREKYQENI